MEDEDLRYLSEAIGNGQAAGIKATAGLFTALLGTLIDKNIISAKTVETEILRPLEDFYKSHPISDNEDGRADAEEALLALALIAKVRVRLGFPV